VQLSSKLALGPVERTRLEFNGETVTEIKTRARS